jgi:predicted ester cyclase
MATEALEVIRRSLSAMNAHDAAGAAMCAAPDVEINGPTGELHGRDAVQAISQTFMTAFPDNEWVIAHQVASGDTVATEYLLEGTHSGTLTTPVGALTPTGKRVRSRLCDVSRVRDNEIVSVHLYWDNLAFMEDLGVLPQKWAAPRVFGAVPRTWEPNGGGETTASEDIVGRLHEALNAHDLKAVAALADAEIEVAAPTINADGRDAFRRMVVMYFDAFPDIRWHIMHQVASGDTVVTEHLVEGTHGGAFTGPGAELGATGNRGLTRVSQVVRVRHGAMASVHLYWDHLVLLQTMGAFS